MYNDIDNFINLGCMFYIVLNCWFDDVYKSILWCVFVIKYFKYLKYLKFFRENSDGMIYVIGDVKI